MGATLPLLGFPDVQESVLKSNLGRRTRRPQVLGRARTCIQPRRLRPHRPLRLSSSLVSATYNSCAVAAASTAPKSKHALSRMAKDKVQDLARSMGLDDSGRKNDVVDRVLDAYLQIENGNGKAAASTASAAAPAAPHVADAKADQKSAAAKSPVIGGYDLQAPDSATGGGDEEAGISTGENASARMPTFDDLFAMPRVELVQQCRAVGLPHSKRIKEDLATSLLATMQSGAATPSPSTQPGPGVAKPSHPTQPGSDHTVMPPDNTSEERSDTSLQDEGKPGFKQVPQSQLQASPGFFSQRPTSAELDSQGGTPDPAADSGRRRVKRASRDAQGQAERGAEPAETESKAGVETATATRPEAKGGGQDAAEGHKADMFADASWLKPISEEQREATLLVLSSMRRAELQQKCDEAGIQQEPRSSKQNLLQNLADFLKSQQQRPQQLPVERDASEDALGGAASADKTAALAEEEQALDALTKSQLQQRCQEAGVAYLKRWGRGQLLDELKLKLHQQRQEAQLPEEVPRALAGARSLAQNASSEDLAAGLGTRQYEVADADGSVKDVGIPGSEGAGQGRRSRRRRVAPLTRDMDDVGPAAELGVHLPELDPTAPDTAVADNAMDTDTDVVAQQRRTDKQPADLPNQEGQEEDVQELAMDEVLMLDQEPEPGFDLDDAQRPRLSRDAEGDLTEANFGNDDETMTRLEDMGTSGADLVGNDMQRQGQGGAQRRRQASRTAFVREDEDDEFGSRLTEARFPDATAEGDVDGDSTDGEEEAQADYRDAAGNARPGVRGRYQAAEDGDFSDLGEADFIEDDDFADGFKISNIASESLALDEDDDDAPMDGAAMTNQQFGRVRRGFRSSLEAAGVRNSSAAAVDAVEDAEEDDEQQQPTQAQPRPKQTPTAPLPPTPPVTSISVPTPGTRRQPTAAATAPTADPVSDGVSEEPASDSGAVTQARPGAKTGFPVPDWLASRQGGASWSGGASRPTGQPSVQMTAMSFKPKKRPKAAVEPDFEPAAEDLALSSTAGAASTNLDPADEETPPSLPTAGAASSDRSSALDAELDDGLIPPAPREELAAAESPVDSDLVAQSSPAAEPAAASLRDQFEASNDITLAAASVKAAKAATRAVLELTDLASKTADDAKKAPDRATAVEKALESANLAEMASDQFKVAADAAAATLGGAKADETQVLAQAAGTGAGAAARKAAETAVDLQSEKARSAALQVTQDFQWRANEAVQVGMENWEPVALADVQTALREAALEQRSKEQMISGSPAEDPGAQTHKAMDAGPGAKAAAAYETVQEASARTVELADLTEIVVGDAEGAEDQDQAAPAAKRAASGAQALTEEYATAVAAAVEANVDGEFSAAFKMAQEAGGEAAAFTRAAAEAAADADTQEAISAALAASEALKSVAAAATEAGMATDMKTVEEAHEELAAMQQQSESSPSTGDTAQDGDTPAGAIPPEAVNLEPSLTPEAPDTADPTPAGHSNSGSPASAPAPIGAEALAANAPSPLGDEALAQAPSPGSKAFKARQIAASNVESNPGISAEAQNVIDAGIGRALSDYSAASPALGAPDRIAQEQAVVQAALSAQIPQGRSRPALSDELGHNDIAGADAHRRTDAELSSQTFTDAVQGALPSTSALPADSQADSPASLQSGKTPAQPARKADTTVPSSQGTPGSAEQALQLRSNASGSSKLTDAEVEDLVAAEQADYALPSSRQSSQTNETPSSGISSNSKLTDAEVEGLVAAEQANYPALSSQQSSQTSEMPSSGFSSDSRLTDAEVEDLTAAGEVAHTVLSASSTAPQPMASSPSQAPSASPTATPASLTASLAPPTATLASPTATPASPTATLASPIAIPASPGPLAPSSTSAPASSLPMSGSTSASKAARPAQDPPVPATPTASSLGSPPEALSAPPAALKQELEADLAGLQALRAQVADKQAALASMEAQLGSTNASAAGNRSQIQKLQLQMTELQDQHMAWQQNMLDGRLQELRTAAARVENNQSLKAELQQQVEGMSSQLNSLEASLKASDKQIGNLQQELASLGKSGPKPAATIQVNGRHPPNLPKGAFFEAADLTPEEEAEQQQAPSRSQADKASEAKAQRQLGQNQVGSSASDDRQQASSQPDADPKSTAIQPGVAVTFGLMRVAEAGQATANFFSGLWGKKPKPPS